MLRDQRQEEFANVYLKERTGRGILYLCPRFGKCRVAIKVFKKLVKPKILIAYPDAKIKVAWQEEFGKTNYKNPSVTYTTFRSLEKHSKGKFDMIVIDEIHLLSERQIAAVQGMMSNKAVKVMGLTGTLNSWSETVLRKRLFLNVLAHYSITQAVNEGVITDYEIIVKKVPLDNVQMNTYKNNVRTERGQFRAYSAVIDKMEEEGRSMMTKFLRLGRMRIIQNSISKLEATKKLLTEFSSERVLVFCGLTATADLLGCPVYHSKKGEKQTFEDFSNGKGNHLAVVKIGNTGVTYKPLNKVIINYFDSNAENLAQKINRCMAMEYGNVNKKATIYIVTSDEAVELKWLAKALAFFDEAKITYEN